MPPCGPTRAVGARCSTSAAGASRDHFAAGNGNGVALETGSLRAEVLAALAPSEWVVVDAGCGDGFLTEVLAERFAKVLAFDHSPERLAAAKERIEEKHVRFRPGEVDDLPLRANSTDALFLSMVLHHVPEIGAALNEARRVLRPGGRVVVADLAPHEEESMRESMGDLRLGLDPTRLAGSLKDAGFEDVHLLPVRDRLMVGRTPLELILAAGRWPGETQDQTEKHVTQAIAALPFKVADLSLAEFGRNEIRSPSRRCPA